MCVNGLLAWLFLVRVATLSRKMDKRRMMAGLTKKNGHLINREEAAYKEMWSIYKTRLTIYEVKKKLRNLKNIAL